MNRQYNTKMDLQFRCNNSDMEFMQFDKNTSDFMLKITRGGKLFDIEKALVTLVVIKPNSKVEAQFVEVENGLVYADLKPNMIDTVGKYQARAMIVLDGETVTTDVITYTVNEDKIISQLNNEVVSDERFTLLTDALNRMSTIETTEEQRQINESERILQEEQRQINENARKEAELVREHQEADREKAEAIREEQEHNRQVEEAKRVVSENKRVEDETIRVDNETIREANEQTRKDNYNFMTEDEERRRLEANQHKANEEARKISETERVNEEARRRTTEQARKSSEITREANETNRYENEVIRQANESDRNIAETNRQNRYNSFINSAENAANNFEDYTNRSKVEEESRKSNETTRMTYEDKRQANESTRITNENQRKYNETERIKSEEIRVRQHSSKMNEANSKIEEVNKVKVEVVDVVDSKTAEIEMRFNKMSSSQQQDSEVIDARGESDSLRNELERIETKAKEIYDSVEGTYLSLSGTFNDYVRSIQILGNTIQGNDLSDIRSVGDPVEGQNVYQIPLLCVGKNLCLESSVSVTGNTNWASFRLKYGKLDPSKQYVLSYMHKASVSITNPRFEIVYTDGSVTKSPIATPTIYEYQSLVSVLGKTIDFIRVTFSQASSTCVYEAKDIQLEEGTVATTYEPYKSHELTILSPCQLEKVGTVSDILYENGDIDKYIITYSSDGSKATSINNSLLNVNSFELTGLDISLINGGWSNITSLSNRFKCVPFSSISTVDEECFAMTTSNGKVNIRIHVLKAKVSNLEEFKVWVKGMEFKYISSAPTKHKLPHSQQVILRTFAPKTNILSLTKNGVEPTFKGQVAKSKDAVINTHTEQIDNIYDELDRVKKLEESTVSVVRNEGKDFVSVEATNGGYFEDVELKGRTLVNLYDYKRQSLIDVSSRKVEHIQNGLRVTNKTTYYVESSYLNPSNIKPNTNYTLIWKFKDIQNANNTGLGIGISNSNGTYLRDIVNTVNNNLGTFKFNTGELSTNEVGIALRFIRQSTATSVDVIAEYTDIMMLEGDHTQAPPSYFQGLASVGEGTDEIVVSSVNENLFTNTGYDKFEDEYFYNLQSNKNKLVYTENVPIGRYYISGIVQGLTSFTQHISVIGIKNDGTSTEIKSIATGVQTVNSPYVFDIELNISEKFAKIGIGVQTTGMFDFKYKDIIFSTSKALYTPHKTDKKRLLRLNPTTQTWEKPILREWDSVEKHSDGKYYYHQRSGQVVLNGSENWVNYVDFTDSVMQSAYITIPNMLKNTRENLICDNLVPMVSSKTNEYIYNRDALAIGIHKSKLTTQDLAGLKAWLQANNVTVVYQLAEEKVYECTNLDLITYPNATNLTLNGGYITPNFKAEYRGTIMDVVTELQRKVSLLEADTKATQEVQDMIILESDMRIMEIEMALMDFVPMQINLRGDVMLRSATYFNFLKSHIENETYSKEYLENVMNKYLATNRIDQAEYDELYKMLYPPVYDIPTELI